MMKLWQFAVGRWVLAALIIASSKVLAGPSLRKAQAPFSGNGQPMMVNIVEQQATVLWSVELNDTASAKPFAHPNGRVVYVPYGGQLMALATEDGKQLWTQTFDSRVHTVASRGNHVLVGLSDNLTASVDGHNGRTLWVSANDVRATAISPDGNSAYVAEERALYRAPMVSSGHDVEALTDWQPPKKTTVYPPMLMSFDGSRTFLMAKTQPGSLAAVQALSTANGSVMWESEAKYLHADDDSIVMSNDGQTIFASTRDDDRHGLTAIDAGTGKTRWQSVVQEGIRGAEPMSAENVVQALDGSIYAATHGGGVKAIEPQWGSTLRFTSLSGAVGSSSGSGLTGTASLVADLRTPRLFALSTPSTIDILDPAKPFQVVRLIGFRDTRMDFDEAKITAPATSIENNVQYLYVSVNQGNVHKVVKIIAPY